MNEQEIIDAYNILSQNVKDQAARDAAIVGNSQRSLGPLAARVASPTGQTSGLANYTYNRLMRPVVDSTAAALTTQGIGQALQKNLNDQLRAAKAAYEDAQNRNTAAVAAANNPAANQTLHEYLTDETLGGVEDIANVAYPNAPAGTILSVGGSGGSYYVTVANGKGGVTLTNIRANSSAEALSKYREQHPDSWTASEWQAQRDFSQQVADAGLSDWEPLLRFGDYINWDALGR